MYDFLLNELETEIKSYKSKISSIKTKLRNLVVRKDKAIEKMGEFSKLAEDYKKEYQRLKGLDITPASEYYSALVLYYKNLDLTNNEKNVVSNIENEEISLNNTIPTFEQKLVELQKELDKWGNIIVFPKSQP